MAKLNKFKIFKNIYILLPIGSAMLFILLYLNPWGIIPDILSLSINGNVATYLATVISSISSLTGFLIAILIVAFEFYKRNLNKIYLEYFIENKALVLLINLYIFVFIFAGMSLLLLGSGAPKSVGELTVCYISLIAFLLLIPATFLLSFLLVKSLNINNVIDDYLNKLSFDEVFLINVNNKIFPNGIVEEDGSAIVEFVDRDCLIILQKLIINSLQNDDYVKAQIVLNVISEKFTNYIINKEEPDIKNNTVFHQYRYASFLLTLVSETKLNPKMGERLIFDKVIEMIEDFYLSYNQKKFKISYIEPFRDSTYTKMFKMCKGNDDQIEQILKSIQKIIEDTISNNLPEEKYVVYFDSEYRREYGITDENKAQYDDFETYYSWRKFLENYPKYFILQANEAIDNRSENRFLGVLSLYKWCVFSYWKYEKTHKYLLSMWIIHNFMDLIALYKDAIEKKIVRKLNAYHLISDTDIINMFDNDYLCARIVLMDYLHFMAWLSEKRKLNYSIFCGVYSMIGDQGTFYTGNNLTMLGCYFSGNYHRDDRFKNGLEDVINTVNIVFDNYKSGKVSKEVNYGGMVKVLEKIKESYMKSRIKQPKSQKLLRKLNKIILEIKTEDNNT